MAVRRRACPCAAPPTTPQTKSEAFLNKSLTMSYFHTGVRTIIGAKAFHCPVRDGKEWGRLAMVIRHNWSLPRHRNVCQAGNS